MRGGGDGPARPGAVETRLRMGREIYSSPIRGRSVCKRKTDREKNVHLANDKQRLYNRGIVP